MPEKALRLQKYKKILYLRPTNGKFLALLAQKLLSFLT
jgi:hypothetical protein